MLSANEEEQKTKSKMPKLTKDHLVDHAIVINISKEDKDMAHMLLSMQVKATGKIKKKKDYTKNKLYTHFIKISFIREEEINRRGGGFYTPNGSMKTLI